jgi:hypothetical protein
MFRKKFKEKAILIILPAVNTFASGMRTKILHKSLPENVQTNFEIIVPAKDDQF